MPLRVPRRVFGFYRKLDRNLSSTRQTMLPTWLGGEKRRQEKIRKRKEEKHVEKRRRQEEKERRTEKNALEENNFITNIK